MSVLTKAEFDERTVGKFHDPRFGNGNVPLDTYLASLETGLGTNVCPLDGKLHTPGKRPFAKCLAMLSTRGYIGYTYTWECWVTK